MPDRTAFDDACRVEQKAESRLIPLFDAVDPQWTKEERLAEQFRGRDYFLKNVSAELKAESQEKWGNFFLETWSHKKKSRRGWLYTCTSPLLIYAFLDHNVAYFMGLQVLRDWAFAPARADQLVFEPEGDGQRPNIECYRPRFQAKYKQDNDTWGRPAPINKIKEVLGDMMLMVPISRDSAPAVSRWLERTILASTELVDA